MTASTESGGRFEGRSATRRALLTSSLGALAALVASAVGRPLPVDANGETVKIGDTIETATVSTSIANFANTLPVFRIWSWPGGSALEGFSGSSVGITVVPGARGVLGVTTVDTGAGVDGQAVAGAGVRGRSESGIGVSGASTSGMGLAGSSAALYGVYGEANGSGSAAIGVHGTSNGGIGMLGKSRATSQPGTVGWSANNSTGLQGFSNDNSASPPVPRAKTGVFGQATQDSSSRGVVGVSSAGNGVRGEATTGVGVQGVASNLAGYAFRGSGRIRFDKVSGLATIAAGKTSVVITPGTDVTTESFVLLTPMNDLGGRRLWFTRDTTNNRFTIRLSSSRTSSTTIAWLLLS